MKFVRLFVASVLIALGLGIGTQPAHATLGYAYCTTAGDFWYLHASFIVGGGIQSWATCVPAGTSVPWPDGFLPHDAGIAIVKNFESSDTTPDGVGFYALASNYEVARSVGTWGNTVVAALGCSTSNPAIFYSGFYLEYHGSYGVQYTYAVQRPCQV